MDWIRRNWPDLLIAIALVAVIAGIIATLLSGGSLWPTSGSGGNQQLSQGRTALNGGVNGNTGTPAINLRGAANTNAGNASGLSVGNAPTGNSLAGSTLNRGNVEVVAPGVSGTNSQTTLNANTGATLAAPLGARNNNSLSLAAPLTSTSLTNNGVSSPRAGASISADINSTGNAGRGLSIGNNNAATNAQAGGVVSTNGVTIPNTANPASTAGSQQLAGRTSFASPQAINVNPVNPSAAAAGGSYKISVGAFGVAANAQNLANGLAQQGYPVGFDQQGRLNVVYVGPFNSQAEADAVASQLRQGGQDTSVYADPQARANTTNTANVASNTRTTQQQFAASNQATQQNFQQQQAVATSQASVGRSFLQVGAYNDVPSSLTQRSRLESLGLTVYDRREGGYVKLIVGPFASNEVDIYRSQLRDRGIDSFPVN